MTDVPEEVVVAFVDGRLTGPGRAAFEARLQNDPTLAERVAAHRWMARQIVAAYGPPLGDEVDDALMTRLGLATDNVVAMAVQRPSAPRRAIFPAALAGAIAASLVIGLFIGRSLLAPDTLLRADGNGQIVAAGILAHGLSDRLAGQPGQVRIGISFRTADGICRTFTAAHGVSGLGCRHGTEWVIPMTVSGSSASEGSGDYRLAGGDVAASVMAEADRRMTGEPLTLSEERKFKANDWH